MDTNEYIFLLFLLSLFPSFPLPFLLISQELDPLEPPLAMAIAEIEKKVKETSKLGKKADRIEAYCGRETHSLDGAVDKTVMSLQRMPTSEVRVLYDIRFPSEGMTAVMKAVCLLRGVGAKKSKDPKGGFGKVDDWWKTGRAMLNGNQRALLNKLGLEVRHRRDTELVQRVVKELVEIFPVFKDARRHFEALRKVREAVLPS